MKKIYKKPLMEETEVKFEQPLMAGSNEMGNGEPVVTDPDEEDFTI